MACTSILVLGVTGCIQILRRDYKRSYVSISKWMQKYSHSSDKFEVNRHSVRNIFVDLEMMIVWIYMRTLIDKRSWTMSSARNSSSTFSLYNI
jgi:hypothetical protein